jgi:KDO2-lipid IV(A) lauroyltransferase
VRREVTVDNIERALGVTRAQAVRIGRGAYRNLGRSLFEFAAFARFSREDVRALVSLEGMEHLRDVHAHGRGAVFVTGHHGSWELMGAVMAANGFPVDYLVGQQSNGRVDEVMNELRGKLGSGIIRRTMALKKVLQTLADNRIVAMLADQDARSQGIMVDFLGRPASTVRGPALFAVRRNCPLLTGFIHRDGPRHRAFINPPLYAPPGMPEEEAVRYLTQAHADALARHIRDFPEEYFWPHRRWKTKATDL